MQDSVFAISSGVLKNNLGYSNGTVDFTRRRIISLLFHFVLRFYLHNHSFYRFLLFKMFWAIYTL